MYWYTAVANNIITVGSEGRSEILASLLTGTTTTTRSKRGFVTHTGKFNGVPVSVVLINMGYGGPVASHASRCCGRGSQCNAARSFKE